MFAAADVPARPDQVRLLVEETEGWAAGLRLAAESLREADDPDQFLSGFIGSGRCGSAGAALDPRRGRVLTCQPALRAELRLRARRELNLALDPTETMDVLRPRDAVATARRCGLLWSDASPTALWLTRGPG
ncbi:hypothetical protein GCM10023320_07930 [Pseudonocardia adelaidensis]|uniref:Uncharacterized protein n=1 Tax=Pseudonocardia adelaidensis TaxID=648754 RepID=A0ABP9NC36_9PSEU